MMHVVEVENGTYSIGFDLLEVTMKKIHSYNDTATVPFDTKFTSIVGPTGSGKTTILDSVSFALYARNSRTDAHLNMNDIIKPGGFVHVTFMKNGNVYHVKRGIRDDGSSYVELHVNENRFHSGIKATNFEIERVMGMNYDAFVSSSIIRQGEIKMFSQLTASQRLSKLQSLFQLKIFDKALQKAKDDFKRVEKEIFNLKGESEGIKLHVDREGEFKETILSCMRNVVENSRRKKTLEAELAGAMEKLEATRKDREVLGALVARKEELENTISSMQDQATMLRSGIDVLNYELAALEVSVPGRGTMARLKELQGIENDARDVASAHASRMQVLDEQRERYESLLKKYEGGISLDEYTKIAKKAGAAMINNDSYIAMQLDADVERNKPEVVKGVVSSVLKDEMQVAGISDGELKTKIDRLMEEATVIRMETGLSSTDRVDDVIARIVDATSKLSWKRMDIASKENALSSMESLLETKKAILEKVDGEIASKEDVHDEIEIIHDQVERFTGELSTCTTAIAESNGIIKVIKDNLKAIDEFKEIIKKNADTISDLEEDKDILDEIVTNVLHNRGVTKHAVETIMGAVELRASEILNYMSEGKKSLIKFEPVANGFEIYVDEVLAGARSGGEQTQINASIRLAIAEKISEMSVMGAQMKTLFIDEGDIGSLDTESARDKFIDTIFTLEKYFNKIILITHMSEIADKFGRKIRVEKNAVFSRVTC